MFQRHIQQFKKMLKIKRINDHNDPYEILFIFFLILQRILSIKIKKKTKKIELKNFISQIV